MFLQSAIVSGNYFGFSSVLKVSQSTPRNIINLPNFSGTEPKHYALAVVFLAVSDYQLQSATAAILRIPRCLELSPMETPRM